MPGVAGVRLGIARSRKGGVFACIQQPLTTGATRQRGARCVQAADGVKAFAHAGAHERKLPAMAGLRSDEKAG